LLIVERYPAVVIFVRRQSCEGTDPVRLFELRKRVVSLVSWPTRVERVPRKALLLSARYCSWDWENKADGSSPVKLLEPRLRKVFKVRRPSSEGTVPRSLRLLRLRPIDNLVIKPSWVGIVPVREFR